MRVALLTSTRERCGIAAYSRALAEALAGRVDVDVVPVDPQPPGPGTLARLNAADLVHIQHEYSFWGSALPGRSRFPALRHGLRRPWVMTAHTVAPAATVAGVGAAPPPAGARVRLKRWAVERELVRRFIECDPFAGARAVIVHTPAARSMLLERGLAPERLHVLPMPCPQLPAPASAPEVRREIGIGECPFLLAFGFLSPAKGFESLVRAIASIPAPLILVIAGEAPDPLARDYRAGLQRLAADLGAGERVRFPGYLPGETLATLLQEAELVVLPYRAGTASYAASMALAAGAAVLVSDLPVFAGLPVARTPPDAAGVLAAVNDLLGDGPRRRSLREAATKWAAANTWAAAAAVHEGLYRACADPAPRPAE